MTIGTSLIGNDYTMGGGAIPVAGLMGVTGSSVGGFNMTIIPVPEPSSMVLAGLGAASLLLFRRRK